jgi:protein-tyrosine-phosphatase
VITILFACVHNAGRSQMAAFLKGSSSRNGTTNVDYNPRKE